MPDTPPRQEAARGRRFAPPEEIDLSAGGADSSPLETVPSGEKAAAAEHLADEHGLETPR